MYLDPYQHSSTIYDATSRFVPYDVWANHIIGLLKKYKVKKPKNILELSCGTGSLYSFLFLNPDIQYFMSDISMGMLKGAKLKCEDTSKVSHIFCMDNLNLCIKQNSFDLVIMLFDSINYITDPILVKKFFEHVSDILTINGVFIFDFTTPLNSLTNSEDDFSENYEETEITFTRISSYDVSSQIHTTRFEIPTENGIIIENHIERTYSVNEMKEIILGIPGLEIIALLDEFEDKKFANESSERAHVLVRKVK